MFKTSQLKVMIVLSVLIFAALIPTLAIADGPGNPPPPHPPEPPITEGGSDGYTDLELIVTSTYYVML